MKVQPFSGQTYDSGQSAGISGGEQSVGPRSMPAVFDAAGHRPSEGAGVANGATLPGSSPFTGSKQFGVPASYASKPSGHLQADLGNQGVVRDDKGQALIRQGGQTYPVRYDKDNGTWRVYSPENPTKYQYAVKQDERGDWHTHGQVGLPGGWLGDAGQAKHQAIANVRQQIQHLQAQSAQLTHSRQWYQNQVSSPHLTPEYQMQAQAQVNNLSGQIAAVTNQLSTLQNQLQNLQS